MRMSELFENDEKKLAAFHKSLGNAIKGRISQMHADMAIQQAKNPDQWRFKKGDQVYSKSTGNIYTITNLYYDSKRNRAMYFYSTDNGEGRGSLIADLANKSLIKLNDNKMKENESLQNAAETFYKNPDGSIRVVDHKKAKELNVDDTFEYGFFGTKKGTGTVVKLEGLPGKEYIIGKTMDGKIGKFPYHGPLPKNGYYIKKINNKSSQNTVNEVSTPQEQLDEYERFVEYATEKLAKASSSHLLDMAKKLSNIEKNSKFTDTLELMKYATHSYNEGLTPIVHKIYADEMQKRGFNEPNVSKPDSLTSVRIGNSDAVRITGPEAWWEREISKWGGKRGREIAYDLKDAGYVKNLKEFLYMLALVKTMPELKQEVSDSGISIGSLEEYMFYAKQLKNQGLIGNQEYLDSHFNDEKLKQRLSLRGVKEDATAGATSSASIATVVNPGMTNKGKETAAGKPGKMAKKRPKQMSPKKQSPSDNALDSNAGLMTGTPIKR